MKKGCFVILAVFLIIGVGGSSSPAWSQSATDAKNPHTGAVTPVKTLDQAEADDKEKARKPPSKPKPFPYATTAPDQPLSAHQRVSVTNETVDMNGNTVSTIQSYQEKALRRRLTTILDPLKQVREQMTEVFSKTGEIQSIHQIRFGENGAKIFDGLYQFTGNNISKAQIDQWIPDQVTTAFVFDKQGFPVQQTVTYPDGTIKNFDAVRSEASAQALLAQELPTLDPASVRPGTSRFLKIGDFSDGTFYPGGFIGLHFITFQVGEKGPALSYIGGLDPLTGDTAVIATRTTTDYLTGLYGGTGGGDGQ